MLLLLPQLLLEIGGEAETRLSPRVIRWRPALMRNATRLWAVDLRGRVVHWEDEEGGSEGEWRRWGLVWNGTAEIGNRGTNNVRWRGRGRR